jgi:hypothetical protein
MTLERSPDKRASLRLTFLKLEQAPPDCDQTDVADFRRAMLNALADAEADFAIIQNLASFETVRTGLGLSIAELEDLEDSYANIPLHKLD